MSCPAGYYSDSVTLSCTMCNVACALCTGP